MSAKYQIVIDVHDATRELKFWAKALRYVPEPPPPGYAGWGAFWRARGLAESECSDEPDSIVDPEGHAPRIWFHVMPEDKIGKNRLHFDLRASGEFGKSLAVRKQLVEDEVARLVRLGATRLETMFEEGVDHYAVGMLDPEGNEFDVN